MTGEGHRAVEHNYPVICGSADKLGITTTISAIQVRLFTEALNKNIHPLTFKSCSKGDAYALLHFEQFIVALLFHFGGDIIQQFLISGSTRPRRILENKAIFVLSVFN